MEMDDGAKSALELWRDEAVVQWVPTGWPAVDALLGGGVATGELCEVVGSVAKTVLCHRLCAACCLSASASASTALYIDTCGSFSPRLLAAAIASTVEDTGTVDAVMARAFVRDVRVVQAGDADAVAAVLEALLSECDDEFCATVRLVVVDSLAAVLAPALGATSALGHAAMIRLARLLKRVAHERGAAVVATNWVVASAASGLLRPALGETWRCAAHTQLALDRRGPSTFAATLLRSPRRPAGLSVVF